MQTYIHKQYFLFVYIYRSCTLSLLEWNVVCDVMNGASVVWCLRWLPLWRHTGMLLLCTSSCFWLFILLWYRSTAYHFLYTSVVVFVVKGLNCSKIMCHWVVLSLKDIQQTTNYFRWQKNWSTALAGVSELSRWHGMTPVTLPTSILFERIKDRGNRITTLNKPKAWGWI